MKRQDNPELKRHILNHLAELYQIGEVREPNHLSSYVYCRTRTFLDQKQTTTPTDEEVMLFALGYGLQDVLTPKGAEAPVYEEHGIIYRPDMVFKERVALPPSDHTLGQAIPADIVNLAELKTTRKSAKFHYIDEHIPETWLDYMKGGCYLRKVNQYDLIVLYMMGSYSPPFPNIYCDTFIFDDAEIQENWKKIMSNKRALDDALSTGQPPIPFQHCYDWECKYCRYQLVCKTIVQAMGYEDKRLEEDKDLWG